MHLNAMLLALWFCAPPEIRTDFPGGNVLVKKTEENAVHLAPDLRGGPAWFYWHFEAEAKQPGPIEFAFPNPPLVGVQGPAVSRDGGQTWRWLGVDRVKFAPPKAEAKGDRTDSFSFTFSKAGEKVRFAVAMPYLQRDLHDFLDQRKANPHLSRSVLTKSRLGKRQVDLVQVGQPGPGVHAMLITARHHACESMASYVLEGILKEAMSDSPFGVAFRKKYVVYAVPIIDIDGVEDGDQGKMRPPRDYNRDYGSDNLHPEIRAIKELGDAKNIRLSLDLHCPFLKGDIHEAFYFVGLGLPHIKNNLAEWTAWLREERPQRAMTPLDLLVDSRKPNAANTSINSHYFAMREGSIFAVCLEVPYAQPSCPLDIAMAREYGVGMLRAWTRTQFLPNAEAKREAGAHADLLAFRNEFLKTYKSKPKEMEALANEQIASTTTMPTLVVEANHGLALLRHYQKKPAEALKFNDLARNDPNATAQQKAAVALARIQIAAADPKATAADVDAALAEAQRLPYSALEQEAKAFEVVGEFYQKKENFEKALDFARRQHGSAANYEKGKLLNRMAMLQDLLKRPEDAVKSRKEAVAFLKPHVEPMAQRSIFGAMMTIDMFDALIGIPTATLEEKRAAAQRVLDHDVVSAATKERVRKTLDALK